MNEINEMFTNLHQAIPRSEECIMWWPTCTQSHTDCI